MDRRIINFFRENEKREKELGMNMNWIFPKIWNEDFIKYSHLKNFKRDIKQAEIKCFTIQMKSLYLVYRDNRK